MIYTDADLRAWRARERLSQIETAKMFHVSQRAMSIWENGKLPRNFTPRFDRVLREYYRARHIELVAEALDETGEEWRSGQ